MVLALVLDLVRDDNPDNNKKTVHIDIFKKTNKSDQNFKFNKSAIRKYKNNINSRYEHIL